MLVLLLDRYLLTLEYQYSQLLQWGLFTMFHLVVRIRALLEPWNKPGSMEYRYSFCQSNKLISWWNNIFQRYNIPRFMVMEDTYNFPVWESFRKIRLVKGCVFDTHFKLWGLLIKCSRMLQFKVVFSILIKLCISCKSRSYFILCSREIKNLFILISSSVMRPLCSSEIFSNLWDMQFNMIYCYYYLHQKDMCHTPLHKCLRKLKPKDLKVHWDYLYWKEEFNRIQAHCLCRRSLSRYG